MKKIFTLSALATLLAAGFSAQAQFTVDGTLNSAEIGTGTGKYQLVGNFNGTHSVADRGLKAIYIGTTSTTLNVMIVASPELAAPSYNALAFYLDVPNKTGIAAGVRLGGGDDNSSQLKGRPIMDMPVDYAFRVTVSPLNNTGGDQNSYYSRLDYTGTPNADGRYNDRYLGPTNKTGTSLNVTDALTNFVGAKLAFQSTASGSVAGNTASGWEFELPLSSLGGLVNGNNINVMAAYLADSGDFYSDILPAIPTQTTALGTDPNFGNIAGKQFYTYQMGTGVLGARAGSDALTASVSPNPVAADSRLTYTVASTSEPVSVVAYNSMGQRALTLLDQPTQPTGEQSLSLAPLQGLAAGVYLLQVRSGSTLSTQRVVVR